MKQSHPRRRFLRQAGLASLGMSLLPEESDAQKKPVPKRYVGVGKTMEEALRSAVNQAERDIRVPDGAVAWKLVEISGTAGGFSGRRAFKVTIETQSP